MGWLRSLIRRHTRPIEKDSATKWRNRLTLMYVLLAWNAFGLVIYNVSTGKADWAEYHGLPKDNSSPAVQWARTLGVKKATVYQIDGTNIRKFELNEETIKGTEEKLAE